MSTFNEVLGTEIKKIVRGFKSYRHLGLTADDLEQSAWVGALTYMKGNDNPAIVFACRQAKTEVVNMLNKAKGEPRAISYVDEIGVIDEPAVDGRIFREKLSELMEATQQLSRKQRDAFLLRYFGTYTTNRQVAKILGLEPAVVGRLIDRAKKKLLTIVDINVL